MKLPIHTLAASYPQGLFKSASPRWLRELRKLHARGDSEAVADMTERVVGPLLRQKNKSGIFAPMFWSESTRPIWREHGRAAVGDLWNRLLTRNNPTPDSARNAYRALASLPDDPQPLYKTRALKPYSPASGNIDEMVPFEHGGTMRFLRDFLSGKNTGYHTDSGGKGIMVHPGQAVNSLARGDGRTTYYATGAYAQALDRPARLSGEVPARYLKQAPNGYEATLTSEGAGHLRNMRLEPIQPDKRQLHAVASYPDKVRAMEEAVQRRPVK